MRTLEVSGSNPDAPTNGFNNLLPLPAVSTTQFSHCLESMRGAKESREDRLTWNRRKAPSQSVSPSCTQDLYYFLTSTFSVALSPPMAVEALDKVTFFDQFFTFLRNLRVLPLLGGLDPGVRVRASIPCVAMMGVYVMRIILGIPSIPQTVDLILTDPALMTLFGLAAFVQHGLTRCGLSRELALPEVRGASSGEVIVDTLVKLSLVDDRVWMWALVMQGKANMGEGRLASVSFDRGFWDGQELYMAEVEG